MKKQNVGISGKNATTSSEKKQKEGEIKKNFSKLQLILDRK